MIWDEVRSRGFAAASVLLVAMEAACAAAPGPAGLSDPRIAEIAATITQNALDLAGKSDDAAGEICARLSASLIDVDAVAKAAAARVWDRMSAAQRDAYRAAALRWITRRCVQENHDNKGEKPQIVGLREGEGGDRILAVKSEDPPHFALWRLRGDKRPRVVDVVVDGLSMALLLAGETNAALDHNDNDIEIAIKAIGR